MTKTNYNRVEDAIDQGLQKLKVAALLKEADAAQKGSDNSPPAERKLTPKQMMAIVQQDLRSMYKQDQKIYKIMKLKRETVDRLLRVVNKAGSTPTDKDIEEIIQLKAKVDELKKSKFPEKTDEDVLAAEVGRHIYKRHNVKEEWIPLDTHSDWDKFKKKPKRR